jgi:hypothetical protein
MPAALTTPAVHPNLIILRSCADGTRRHHDQHGNHPLWVMIPSTHRFMIAPKPRGRQ